MVGTGGLESTVFSVGTTQVRVVASPGSVSRLSTIIKGIWVG